MPRGRAPSPSARSLQSPWIWAKRETKNHIIQFRGGSQSQQENHDVAPSDLCFDTCVCAFWQGGRQREEQRWTGRGEVQWPRNTWWRACVLSLIELQNYCVYLKLSIWTSRSLLQKINTFTFLGVEQIILGRQKKYNSRVEDNKKDEEECSRQETHLYPFVSWVWLSRRKPMAVFIWNCSFELFWRWKKQYLERKNKCTNLCNENGESNFVVLPPYLLLVDESR